MKVTRDVVTDLLPAYFSGEASSDTRVLVEAFFGQDPEFARLARALAGPWQRLVPPGPLTKEDAMRTIQRTRRMIRLRGTFLGLAIFFTALPFSVYGNSHQVRWAWQEFPTGSAIAALLAACAWLFYFRFCRNLRAMGA
jgi:hypothetical protein